MNETPQTSSASAVRFSSVQWVIAVSLAAIALNYTFRGEGPIPSALAQNTRMAGARGIFAFSGQLTAGSFGVFMVDVDAGTIWCYEYSGSGGAKRLRLASARSWIYDRYLENFQGDGLTPEEVRDLVEEQRSRRNPPPGKGNNP